MTSIHNLSTKEENYLNPGLSLSDSRNTSENSTLDREKPKKKKNKRVYFNEIQIIDIESYKIYNQNNVCFESLEPNIVKSCNCNLF